MHDENLKAAIAEIRAIIRKYDLFATVIVQSQDQLDGFIIPDPSWGGVIMIGGNEPGLARLEFKSDLPPGQTRKEAQKETLNCIVNGADAMVRLLHTMKDMGQVIVAGVKREAMDS